MLSFFPRGVLDEILKLIESVSEDFPSYSFIVTDLFHRYIDMGLHYNYNTQVMKKSIDSTNF